MVLKNARFNDRSFVKNGLRSSANIAQCSGSHCHWFSKPLRSFSVSCHLQASVKELFPGHDDFSQRHIGPDEKAKMAMLDIIGVKVFKISVLTSSNHCPGNMDVVLPYTCPPRQSIRLYRI